MDRIREIDGVYQVLLTPNVYLPHMLDSDLSNYRILEFNNEGDAVNEAVKYPNMEWCKIVHDHQYIYERLYNNIKQILVEHDVYLTPVLLSGDQLKNMIFDRVQNKKLNLRHGANSIISFTVVDSWFNKLKKISDVLINSREHLHRDDLRIKQKKVVDGKIIHLYGRTELGTVYEIRLIPALLHRWSSWYEKQGFRKQKQAVSTYKNYLKIQDKLDDELYL